MSGWIAAVALAAGAWIAAWRLLGLPRGAWEPMGAALLLGLAGYAWTGRPSQPGAPTRSAALRAPVDERAIDLRVEMGEGFGPANNWLLTSDGALRAGLPSAAVNYLRSGLRDHPESADLWLGLGNALVARAEGRVTPAARFAMARSAALAPERPGPWFFLGLARLREGDVREARRLWAEAVRRTPADAEYRGTVVAAERSLAAMTVPSPQLP